MVHFHSLLCREGGSKNGSFLLSWTDGDSCSCWLSYQNTSLVEERDNEVKDPSMSKREELLGKKRRIGGKKRKKQGNESENEISSEVAIEQAVVMRSQIHLFWGNMLFE